MPVARRNLLILSAALIPLAAIWFVAPIPQDPAYHQFADQRSVARVPNFWNVVSNLPFAVLGVYGLAVRHRLHAKVSESAYAMFCAGVCLVAAGSAYYHLDPSTATLVWDRLPMTIAFMALFAMVIGDRISPRAGEMLLWPLVAVGMASVAYWYWTELAGAGDLRAYALVQFLPMLLIPLMLVLYPGEGVSARWLWAMLAVYGCAKLAEHFDRAIYAGAPLSGHTLKHLLAAGAVFCGLLAVSQVPRRTTPPGLTGMRQGHDAHPGGLPAPASSDVQRRLESKRGANG